MRGLVDADPVHPADIMSTVKILFFAADPLSAPPDGRASRLLLDEDVRQIRAKVRAAEHRDALHFDFRWAARTDDLLQALYEAPPQVVHFSGHGGSEGLVLVSADGQAPHYVDAAALAQLFRAFKGDIRLAVLNACFSLPQAQAIAEAVGCAIGTRGAISDRAAITFGGSFYRAIAFGQSVQAAYDQARAALALEHFEDRECPQLVARPGVDPADIVLVPAAKTAENAETANSAETDKGGRRRVGMTVAGVALAGAAVIAAMTLTDPARGARQPIGTDSATTDTALAQADSAPATVDSSPSDPGQGRPPAATQTNNAARRQEVADPQPDERHASVDPPQEPAESEPVVVKRTTVEDDSFAVIRGRPRDPTLPPAFTPE